MLDSGIELTVIGLDVCNSAAWTEAQFDRLERSGEIGHFVSTSFSKIREFYAGNGTGGRTDNCDALAMMCVIYEDFVTASIRCHGSCITEKGETYGQVIFYQEGFTYDVAQNDFVYNVNLLSDVCEEDCFDLYLHTISDAA